METRKSKSIIVIFTILSSVFFSLLLVELFLKFIKPQKTYSRIPQTGSNCYKKEELYYTSLKPNTKCEYNSQEYKTKVNINNLGFRDTKDISEKTDKKRIVFIGDSFTFGQGVSDTESYPKIVENNLVNAEVINAGMPGSELTWSYLMLKNRIVNLKPDTVVIGFYLGNDLFDLKYFDWENIDENGLPEKISTKFEFVDSDGTRRYSSVPFRYKIPILRESHIFILLTELINGQINFSEKESPITLNGSPCLIVLNCNLLEEEEKKAKKLLLEMKKIADQNNINLVIAILPWEYQLPRNLTSKSGIEVLVKSENRHHFINKFTNYLNENFIKNINILDAFEKYQGSEKVFYSEDRHWTKEGHEIVGNAISEFLNSSETESESEETEQSQKLLEPTF